MAYEPLLIIGDQLPTPLEETGSLLLGLPTGFNDQFI